MGGFGIDRYINTKSELTFLERLVFFPRSVTNRRLVSTAHASLMHAYTAHGIYRSCRREYSMISRAMKSHINELTVRSRPTLKIVKRFRKGSVRRAYERSTIYEQTF